MNHSTYEYQRVNFEIVSLNGMRKGTAAFITIPLIKGRKY